MIFARSVSHMVSPHSAKCEVTTRMHSKCRGTCSFVPHMLTLHRRFQTQIAALSQPTPARSGLKRPASGLPLITPKRTPLLGRRGYAVLVRESDFCPRKGRDSLSLFVMLVLRNRDFGRRNRL